MALLEMEHWEVPPACGQIKEVAHAQKQSLSATCTFSAALSPPCYSKIALDPDLRYTANPTLTRKNAQTKETPSLDAEWYNQKHIW